MVFRGRTASVLLNLFPYNSGHAMVVPTRHRSRLTEIGEAAAVPTKCWN